jgi:hypothetical protein
MIRIVYFIGCAVICDLPTGSATGRMETETVTDPASAGLAEEARRWRQVKPGMPIGVMDLQFDTLVR